MSAAQFKVSRRGYDQSGVRDFLRMVAAELARLQERERYLERELRSSQQSSTPNMATIDEDTAIRLLGEEAARVLQTAREAAGQIRTRAEEGSARLLREATDEAQRLREEAEIEGARRRQDAAADAEAELQMAKQQGRDMVNEARSYRERVLSELSRRRELARQQIEQLIHGRDRLLQAFERSRVAAVEVMAELTPLGEPAEYVNLQPTTGPVPMMVPNLSGTAAPGEADPEEMENAAEVEGAVEPCVATEVDPETASAQTLVVAVDSEILVLADVLVGDFRPAEEEYVEFAPLADDPVEVDPSLGQHSSWPAPHAVGPSENQDSEVDSANVVELFATAADPDVNDAEVEPAPDSTDAATVDDLFARLRAARSDEAAAFDASIAALVEAETISSELAEPSASDDHAGQYDQTSEIESEEVLVPLIVSVARKLKRVLADEQNEVLDTLRRKEPVRAIDAVLPWETEQSDRYAEAVQAELISASVAGARGSDDGKNPAIVRPASDAITNEIVGPLRNRLTRCIDKADGDNAELASQVRSLYREWKTHRIDEHVEEIVRLAYERGAMTVATT